MKKACSRLVVSLKSSRFDLYLTLNFHNMSKIELWLNRIITAATAILAALTAIGGIAK